MLEIVLATHQYSAYVDNDMATSYSRRVWRYNAY